jgi:hypothetical protein
MTKKDEISILKEAASKLGAESYLGPWLRRALPSLEMDINSDFYPKSYGEAEKEAQSIVQDAEMRACEIVKAACERAEKEALKIREEANSYSASVRISAKKRLQDVIADL